MIFDELENLAYYKGIHENLDCAIDYLLTHDLSNYELGRYEINGDKVFFFVQENELNQEENDGFEFHHRYLDLHFLLEGREIIQYGYEQTELRNVYDAEKDIGFNTCNQVYPLGSSEFCGVFTRRSSSPKWFCWQGVDGQEMRGKSAI